MRFIALLLFGSSLSAQISGLSCVGSTDKSIICSWTTVAISDSKVTCGGVSTPVVDQVDTVTPASFYGTTTHKVAVTGNGLLANTQYSCSVQSKTAAGSTTTSGSVNATTSSPMRFPPIRISAVSTPTRLYNINGVYYHDDSRYYSWAQDGNLYANVNDGYGFAACCTNSIGVNQWATTGITGSTRGNPSGANNTGPADDGITSPINYPTTYTADGAETRAEGMACVRGSCYHYTWRSLGGVYIAKSNDGFLTTIGPQHNTGPGAAGLSFTAGVYDYPTTSAGLTLAGGVAFTGYESPVCRAHGGDAAQFACTHNAGSDGWVYFTAMSGAVPSTFGVHRVRVEDIRLTDPTTGMSKYHTYNGGDPDLDASWISWAQGGGKQWLGSTYGQKCHTAFIAGPNHWIGACWIGAPGNADDSVGVNLWDLGLNPANWDHAILLKRIDYDAAIVPRLRPVFPQFNIASIVSLGTGAWTIQLSVTGVNLDATNNPATDGYQPGYYTVTIQENQVNHVIIG